LLLQRQQRARCRLLQALLLLLQQTLLELLLAGNGSRGHPTQQMVLLMPQAACPWPARTLIG
jgi:aspartate carbamoyltransferase catalytic subunit